VRAQAMDRRAREAEVRQAASSRLAGLLEYLQDPRRAITEDGVVCLECGRSFRHLTNTHLRTHGLTSEEYKLRFGYNTRRALMIAPVRRAHADNANRSGLAARIRRRPILEDVELRRLGGRHPHALEEFLTRRERQTRAPLTSPVRDHHGRFKTSSGPGQ
jgi:predicted transcriptional regulator